MSILNLLANKATKSDQPESLDKAKVADVIDIRDQAEGVLDEAKETTEQMQVFIERLRELEKQNNDNKNDYYSVMEEASKADIGIEKTVEKSKHGKKFTKYKPENNVLVKVFKEIIHSLNQSRIVHPLAIKIDDKTFNTRSAFERFSKNQERRLKTNKELTDEQRGEKEKELQSFRDRYGKALKETKELIHKDALYDIKLLSKATKSKYVDEVLAPYVKDGIVSKKEKKIKGETIVVYEASKQVESIASVKQLIDAASKRKKYLSAYFRTKHKFNGFEKFMKEDNGKGRRKVVGRFVFQVSPIEDELTGETLIKIYNVRPLREGTHTDYSEGQVINPKHAGSDTFIQMIPVKMKERQNIRDEQDKKRAEQTGNDKKLTEKPAA